VLLDRITGLIGLLILLLVMQPAFHNLTNNLTTKTALLVLLVTGFSGVIFLLLLSFLPQILHRFKIIQGLVGLSRSARALLLNPKTAIPVLILSVIGHGVTILGVYSLAQALGLNLDYFDLLMILPAVMLISMIPISIGGWGLREGAMVHGLGLLSIGADGALALSILLGLMIMAAGLPGGILWLMGKGQAKQVSQ
jgi:uncharacterized membrane protein YbhN (UPF0104 family)